MNLVTFAKGGGAKSAAKGKTANPLADAAAAIGGGNCGTGSMSGKKGFQPGNKCAGKDRRNSDVAAKRSAHAAASGAARKVLRSKTASVADKQRAVKVAHKAGSELRAAREAHAAGKKESRNAARREARAASKVASAPKPASKPASDPKAEAKATLEKAAASTKATRDATRNPAMTARVEKSVSEAGATKAEAASRHLADLKAGAASGQHDGDAILKHVDRIARGATKDELFAAAKAAGIEHSATTKKALVDQLKNHVYDHGRAEMAKQQPASTPQASAPATASRTGPATERKIQAEILQAVRNPERLGVATRGADKDLVEIHSIRDHVERVLGPVDRREFDRAVHALRDRGQFGMLQISDNSRLTPAQLGRSIPGANDTFAYVDAVKGRTTDKGLARRKRRS